MYGRILNTILNIVFITYLLLLISFYFLHEGMRENINNINYSTIDAIAIQGEFKEEIYNNLKERILAYNGGNSDYDLVIKYEKKMMTGVYDTFYIKDTINIDNPAYRSGDVAVKDPGQIITTDSHKYPFSKGDRITISLQDKKPTLYGKLISVPFLGMLGSTKSFNISSLKTTIVGRNASAVVTGYDVKSEINNENRAYEVILYTELGGASERTFPTKATDPTAWYYDESTDEFKIASKIAGVDYTIGQYHIFSSGAYYREEVDGKVIFYETVR